MLKNLLRYLGGGIVALLFFCNVPVYQGHTGLFHLRSAEAAYNPAWITTINSVAQLTSGNWSNYPYLNLVSYVAGKNKGGGLIYLATTDKASGSNFCTIFVDAAGNRFYRELTSALQVTQCGALGDGSTDDTAAEQAGINSIVNGPIVNTVQGAPAGELAWPPGTYVTTASLTLGSGQVNAGINMHGAGKGATAILAHVSGPVFTIFSNVASNQITDMLIVNGQPSGANNCVKVSGNTTQLKNLWLDCGVGINIDNATDVRISDVYCDQCLGTALFITNSHTIEVSGFEVFGFSSTTSNAVNCTSGINGVYDVTISGLSMIDMGAWGVMVNTGCELTINNYSIDGRFPTPGSPATHRGLWVQGGKVNLGTGTISGWDAEGIFVNGGTVVDSGATIEGNVFSSSAANRAEVAVFDGNYFKTGGSISGGLQELQLVFAGGNADARLSISGSYLHDTNGVAVNVTNGGNPVGLLSTTVANNTMTGLNAGNLLTNTPISVLGSAITNVSNNIINVANPVTSAISMSLGTAIINYNSSNSGTFPANGGLVTSVGNVNY